MFFTHIFLLRFLRLRPIHEGLAAIAAAFAAPGRCLSALRMQFPVQENNPEEAALIVHLLRQIELSSDMKMRDYQVVSEGLRASSVAQEESWARPSDPELNGAIQPLK